MGRSVGAAEGCDLLILATGSATKKIAASGSSYKKPAFEWDF